MNFLYLILFGLINISPSDGFITTLSWGVGLTAVGIYSVYEYAKCLQIECCNSQWTGMNITRLQHELKKHVHGQHLVQEAVVKAIAGHYSDPTPKKALVMSFHGDTGTGKNFVSDIISSSLYDLGDKSQYVHKFIATHHFPHASKVDIYKLDIVDKIREVVRKCERSLFIFDEVHKMHPGIIDAIKPFIDFHEGVNDLDFRRSTFIFLSNTGSREILRFMMDWWKTGNVREDIRMNDLQPLVQNGAFNEQGGLHFAEVIQSSLVDLYVPFLPMERSHIIECIREDLILRREPRDPEVIERVANEMIYFPSSNPLFASKGCKNVHQKVGFHLITLD